MSTSCAISPARSAIRAQLREGLLLLRPREPRLAARDHEHAAPVVGHRVVGEQRGGAVGAGAHAALHDQAAEDEGPQADGRARAAPGRAGDGRRVERRPASAASAAVTASASLVPEPRPMCGGIASSTRMRAPPSSPTASRARCATASARSASGPSAVSSSLAPSPRPPSRDARRPRRARRSGAWRRRRRRACRGAAGPAPRRGPSSSAPTCRRTSSHASRSRGPAVLSTSTCRRASSASISSRGSRPAREARIDPSSTAWRARLRPRNSRPMPRPTTRVVTRARTLRRVDRLDGDLAPRARVREHGAGDLLGRSRGRMRVAERGLREEQDVVGEVDDRGARRLQIAQRARRAVRLDHDDVVPPLDAHRGAVDLPSGLIVVVTVSTIAPLAGASLIRGRTARALPRRCSRRGCCARPERSSAAARPG